MAEGTYVKLTRDQVNLQDIKPGELNQPIDVQRVRQSVSRNFLLVSSGSDVEFVLFHLFKSFWLTITVFIYDNVPVHSLITTNNIIYLLDFCADMMHVQFDYI